ncbi:competence/damage-inducible protein A [Gangjinia marincola]|uniref:CinA-like protein n=1 Tax=Gangjinia marincola TaxID=578463 RepID=A0ABN1MFW9_9FLAO
MIAEIITIGDEILIGQIVDTNSAFIAKELNKIGVSVHQITSIQDEKDHILYALNEAAKQSQLIILTGGLGPTKDDITKHTLCDYFDDELVENNNVLTHVEHLFKKYVKQPILEANRSQAMIPSRATVLHNEYGTAPGMWMEKDDVVYVSMPGVPFEMKGLMQNHVLPKVQERFDRPYIIHKTVLTYGLGESAIADRIEEWEDHLPSHIKLAYLPGLGRVRLRLSCKGKDKEKLEQDLQAEIDKLLPQIEDVFSGFEEENPIEVQIGKLLQHKNATLATVESCTGGKIAARFTSNAGASAYFKGSIVSYATSVKQELLHVPEDIIKRYSVVSEHVVKAMAEGVKKSLKTEYAIATTGNAGPTKGDSDASIGTVCIGIATPTETFTYRFEMGNHRERIVQKTVNKGLSLLLEQLK